MDNSSARPTKWGTLPGMDAAATFRDLGPIFTWASGLRAGLSAYQLRQALTRGDLERVGRGVYRSRASLADAPPWELVRADHVRRCRELLAFHPGHVASHQTAAVVHGLQLRLHPLMDVQLTSVDRVPCSRREAGAFLHHAQSIATDTVTVEGIRTTTVARTVADVLRTSRPCNSLALLDAAVRDGRTTRGEVEAVLRTQVRWRGRPRAYEALELHDPRRESWLESFSFVTLHELGLPMPRPQVEVLDEGFHFVGRVDGLLGPVFLEADGAGKYLLLTEELGLTPEESVALTLAQQEQRHERLTALRLTGVRWTTQEIQHQPEEVVRRVWRALQATDPADFRGWLRRDGRIERPERLKIPTGF